MNISYKWNITIGECLIWLIDSSPPAMFVFVEGTGHLSRKLMMRQESRCQTTVTAWQSAEQHVCDCGRKSEWACVCVCELLKCKHTYTPVSVSVCVSMYTILYLAGGIPKKVMNPIEHKVSQSMIDMRSYFMGAAHACRWALSQFSSFTREGSDALALSLPSHVERKRKQGEVEKSSAERAHDRKITDFID